MRLSEPFQEPYNLYNYGIKYNEKLTWPGNAEVRHLSKANYLPGNSHVVALTNLPWKIMVSQVLPDFAGSETWFVITPRVDLFLRVDLH